MRRFNCCCNFRYFFFTSLHVFNLVILILLLKQQTGLTDEVGMTADEWRYAGLWKSMNLHFHDYLKTNGGVTSKLSYRILFIKNMVFLKKLSRASIFRPIFFNLRNSKIQKLQLLK